jgi:hypothetical protein
LRFVYRDSLIVDDELWIDSKTETKCLK